MICFCKTVFYASAKKVFLILSCENLDKKVHLHVKNFFANDNPSWETQGQLVGRENVKTGENKIRTENSQKCDEEPLSSSRSWLFLARIFF